MAARFAGSIVAARLLIVGGWIAVAVVMAMALPTLHEAQTGALGQLVPADSRALEAEKLSAELFRFPLASRTVVAERDARGLPASRVIATGRLAADVNRGRVPDARAAGAYGVTNAVLDVPFARERDTTALSFLLFPTDFSQNKRLAGAHAYVKALEAPPSSFVGVTGAIPARAEQAHLITEHLAPGKRSHVHGSRRRADLRQLAPARAPGWGPSGWSAPWCVRWAHPGAAHLADLDMAALVTLVPITLFLAPLALRTQDGRNVYNLLALRVGWLRRKAKGSTTYVSGPLSPRPGGRFRPPGMLSRSRSREGRDAYDRPFGVLHHRSRNLYTVVLSLRARRRIAGRPRPGGHLGGDVGRLAARLSHEPGLRARP